MGDSSDNIPGVPGVGEKTALKLLKQFPTVEEVLSSIDQVSGAKLKEKLETYKDQAIMSKELATIMREVPIDVQLDSIEYLGADQEKLMALFKDLGFQSLLEKIGGDGQTDDEPEVFDDIEFEMVEEVNESIFSDENSFYVEVLDANYHYSEIIGFSVVNDKGHFYIPTELALQSPVFKAWAEDESKKKVVYDAKRSDSFSCTSWNPS